MPSTGLLSRGLVGWDVTLASTWTISLNIDVSKKSNIRKKYLKLPSQSNLVPAPAALCSLMAGEHRGRQENC